MKTRIIPLRYSGGKRLTVSAKHKGSYHEMEQALQQALRALADEFGAARGTHVPILVRFPAHGVNLSENFDYATWAKEGWVDYLCPSNIQGRHNHFDISTYQEAVQGTKTTLLPSIDGLSWGNPLPGPFLWRAKQLYDAAFSPKAIISSASAPRMATAAPLRLTPV